MTKQDRCELENHTGRMEAMRNVALVLVVVMHGGCFWVTTKHEGQVLRRDLKAAEDRIEVQENALKAKLARVESVLAQATKLLKRNSADLGAEVTSLGDEMRQMRGLITASKRYTDDVRKEAALLQQTVTERMNQLDARFAALDQRLALLENAPTKKTPVELFDIGKEAFDGGDYETARANFKEIVVRYPGFEKAPNAQYYRGEAYFREGDLKLAIAQFQKVWDKFEKSSLAKDAMYRAGEAAQNLKRCTEARAYFGLLRQKHPSSPLAKKAAKRDRDLKRFAADKKKCES